MIYPKHFEQKIGFDKIRLLIKAQCISDLGKEIVDEIEFSSNFNSVALSMELTSEFIHIIDEGDAFPIDGYFDVRGYLKRIKIEGTFLTESELFELKRSLFTIKNIINFIELKDATTYKHLKDLTVNVNYAVDVQRYIDKILDKFGRIKDNASPELTKIRRSKNIAESSISRILSNIIHKAKSDGYLDSDITPTLREGRLVIPISPAYKRKLGGIVHDESASGKTVYVEPGEVVEANNRIRELEAEEKREITRILQTCAEYIRPFIPDLTESYRFLGIIDFIRAKALFAKQIGGILPELISETHIEWNHAKHPLLFLSLQSQQKDIVPLDILLNKQNRILLISGPNAGGKSVCLKTVGLLQYMGQCGLLVPMDISSKFGLFKNLFIDIGDEQSIENDLSTYSSHLSNMKTFLKEGNEHTLLLIDEFGTGTEPMIGGAIAEAELEVFNQKKCFGVITTHYTNLKHIASQTDGLINGAMLYDRHKMEPLFQLDIGNPGSSFAIEIARKIGLSEQIISNASNKVGLEHINYDKNLQDIVRDKRYWESKRQQIKIKEKKMEENSNALKAQLDTIDKQRKEIIRQAKEEARKLLSDTNATIENTIREIKEAKAEKEKTKEIRHKFEETKKAIREDSQSINPQKNQQAYNKQSKDKSLSIGDYIKYNDNIGQIISIKGERINVAFGQLEAVLNIKMVEKIGRKQVKEQQTKINYNFVSPETNEEIRQRKLKFKQDIDVRGQRVEEAVLTITYFIDDAILVGVSSVRILHGTGTGALRQAIRDYLSTVAGVKSFHDEHVQLGGAGITIVELKD
ncbi:MAG: endonuclease MutS2 [Bacteroidia bacterium]|nr:endonuclease MutS2 [Bacteroidia bacterium]